MTTPDYTAADSLRYLHESLTLATDFITERVHEHHADDAGHLPDHLADVLATLESLTVTTLAALLDCGGVIISDTEDQAMWPPTYSNGVPVYTTSRAGIQALTHPSGYIPATLRGDAI